MVRGLFIALTVLSSGAPASSAATAGACGLTIEFATVGQWQCSGEDSEGCALCRNLGSQVGEIVVRCEESEAGERRQVQPGEELSVCCGAKVPI